MSDLTPVRVSYRVEHVVYVDAATKAEARKLARDVDNWIDADPIDRDLSPDEGARVVGLEARA